MKNCLIIVLFCWVAHGRGQNLTSSLTACYSLNGNATDAINALNGTISAVNSTPDRNSVSGAAMQFAGMATSHIKLPNNSHIKPASEITITGWFRPDTLKWMDILFAKNIYSSYFTAYSLTLRNNGWGPYSFVAFRQNGSGDDSVQTAAVINTKTWYHVAFSIAPDSIKIYLNGILQSKKKCNITQFKYDPSRGVILGGTNEMAWNMPYKGAIDNLRFYSRELSGQEVMMLYQQDPSCLPAPVSAFSASTLQICAGNTVHFTDASANSPTAWNWQVSGIGTFTTQHLGLNFTTAGTYSVSLTTSNANGTSANTATQVITVLQNPPVSAIAQPTFVCTNLNQSSTLTASGAASYLWGAGPPNQVLVVTPKQNTTYVVTGWDENGCMNTATVAVMASICTGTREELTDNALRIYPSPAQQELMIAVAKWPVVVSFFDISGRLVHQVRLEQKISVLDLGSMKPGLYTAEVNGSRIRVLKE